MEALDTYLHRISKEDTGNLYALSSLNRFYIGFSCYYLAILSLFTLDVVMLLVALSKDSMILYICPLILLLYIVSYKWYKYFMYHMTAYRFSLQCRKRYDVHYDKIDALLYNRYIVLNKYDFMDALMEVRCETNTSINTIISFVLDEVIYEKVKNMADDICYFDISYLTGIREYIDGENSEFKDLSKSLVGEKIRVLHLYLDGER